MSILTKLPQLSSNLSPVTQNKIVVTNNYDMPILTEFLLQLNPSQSPEVEIKNENLKFDQQVATAAAQVCQNDQKHPKHCR